MTKGAGLSLVKSKQREKEMWVGGIAACVVCVVLLSLKGIAVEKRKFVGYLEHESWLVNECDWGRGSSEEDSWKGAEQH